MQANHTNEIELSDEKVEKLLNLLRLAENASSRTDAFVLPEEDRQLMGEVRNDITDQTGR